MIKTNLLNHVSSVAAILNFIWLVFIKKGIKCYYKIKLKIWVNYSRETNY